MHVCRSISCAVHKRNIIIIIITTIISIVMCHLIATSSNLHAAAMVAFYEVLLLRGHPSMGLGVRRLALVRGRRRAVAMARQWALDERDWYADDSPCWVEYHRIILSQLQNYTCAHAHRIRPTGLDNLVRMTTHTRRLGRASIIELHHVLQPHIVNFPAQRRARDMRAITMHARSHSR